MLIDNIHYYADILRPWIYARDPHNPKLKRKFIFVRDPRDIGEVYFLDPDTKTYYSVPYRDLTRPRMSVWELSTVLRYIAEHPELQADENTIFVTVVIAWASKAPSLCNVGQRRRRRGKPLV